MANNLYFIAIVPPKPICQQVKGLKEALRESYGLRHALKSPAHVTLQMPFRREATFEASLLPALSCFAEVQKSFEVHIADFGSFAPRVLFLNISPHDPFLRIRNGLQEQLKMLGFSEQEFAGPFHPHMTLANRDLKADIFPQVWQSYAERAFRAVFVAEYLTLLKHNGKQWDLYRSFAFGQG